MVYSANSSKFAWNFQLLLVIKIIHNFYISIVRIVYKFLCQRFTGRSDVSIFPISFRQERRRSSSRAFSRIVDGGERESRLREIGNDRGAKSKRRKSRGAERERNGGQDDGWSLSTLSCAARAKWGRPDADDDADANEQNMRRHPATLPPQSFHPLAFSPRCRARLSLSRLPHRRLASPGIDCRSLKDQEEEEEEGDVKTRRWIGFVSETRKQDDLSVWLLAPSSSFLDSSRIFHSRFVYVHLPYLDRRRSCPSSGWR